MILDRVTITGVDETSNPDDLLRISQRYPFVEWGFLLKESLPGTGRYVSTTTLKRFLPWAEAMCFSGHICGKWGRDMLVGYDSIFQELHPYMPMFTRLQWNVNASRNPYDLRDVEHLFATRDQYRHIIQCNKSNELFVALLLDAGVNFDILYDASGGRGIVAKTWPPASDLAYYGYAGGLRPDNLAGELAKINMVAGPYRIWIDMESGVRNSNDILDLGLVTKVLAEAERWLHAEYSDIPFLEKENQHA